MNAEMKRLTVSTEGTRICLQGINNVDKNDISIALDAISKETPDLVLLTLNPQHKQDMLMDENDVN